MHTTIESTATAAARYGFITPRTEWYGFTGLLESWIESPSFTHTHHLEADDYRQVFDHIFLMIGRLRKKIIAVRVSDTGAGDERDEIRLLSPTRKFIIRPI